MGRAASRLAVTSGTNVVLFQSDKVSGGSDGSPVMGVHLEVPLKDSSGATVSGAATFTLRPVMKLGSGSDQEVTLYPGEVWAVTQSDRNVPITEILVRKAGASDSCVVFRPIVF